MSKLDRFFNIVVGSLVKTCLTDFLIQPTRLEDPTPVQTLQRISIRKSGNTFNPKHVLTLFDSWIVNLLARKMPKFTIIRKMNLLKVSQQILE